MLAIFGATTLLALAASTLRSPSPCRPGTLFTVRSDNPWHRASTLTIVGDLDGDGADEFVVASGAPSTLATLHSGRDGRTLSRIESDAWDFDPMRSATSLGDLDGDSSPEVLIGDASWQEDRGRALVVRLADGRTIHEWHGREDAGWYGMEVAPVGDVNADGITDFAIASRARAGYVEFRSGADGAILHVAHGAMSEENFGATIRPLGDLDGDGHREVAVGAYRDGIDVLYVVSTATWRNRFVARAPAPKLALHALCVVPDENGDGIEDLLVTTPESAWRMSGSDGELLESVLAGSYPVITPVGEQDGDGVTDLVCRTWDSRPAGRWPWSHTDFARVRLVAGGSGDTLLDDWCGSWNPGVVGPLRLGRSGFTGFLVHDVGEVRAYTMCR